MSAPDKTIGRAGGRSVADRLRAETHAAAAGRTPAERIALALRLGD